MRIRVYAIEKCRPKLLYAMFYSTYLEYVQFLVYIKYQNNRLFKQYRKNSFICLSTNVIINLFEPYSFYVFFFWNIDSNKLFFHVGNYFNLSGNRTRKAFKLNLNIFESVLLLILLIITQAYPMMGQMLKYIFYIQKYFEVCNGGSFLKFTIWRPKVQILNKYLCLEILNCLHFINFIWMEASASDLLTFSWETSM